MAAAALLLVIHKMLDAPPALIIAASMLFALAIGTLLGWALVATTLLSISDRSVSVLDAMHRSGLVEISAQRPAIYHPLTPLLQAGFAAFDFARAPFAPLSQMMFTLGRRADR